MFSHLIIVFFPPQHLRPETIKYVMTVEGKDIEMQLEKNK